MPINPIDFRRRLERVQSENRRRAGLGNLIQSVVSLVDKRKQQEQLRQLRSILSGDSINRPIRSDEELLGRTQPPQAVPSAVESLTGLSGVFGGRPSPIDLESAMQADQPIRRRVPKIDARELIKTVPTNSEQLIESRLQTVQLKDRAEKQEIMGIDRQLEQIKSAGLDNTFKDVVKSLTKRKDNLIGRQEKNSKEMFRLKKQALKESETRQRGEGIDRALQGVFKSMSTARSKLGVDFSEQEEEFILNNPVKGQKLIDQKTFQAKEEQDKLKAQEKFKAKKQEIREVETSKIETATERLESLAKSSFSEVKSVLKELNIPFKEPKNITDLVSNWFKFGAAKFIREPLRMKGVSKFAAFEGMRNDFVAALAQVYAKGATRISDSLRRMAQKSLPVEEDLVNPIVFLNKITQTIWAAKDMNRKALGQNPLTSEEKVDIANKITSAEISPEVIPTEQEPQNINILHIPSGKTKLMTPDAAQRALRHPDFRRA